MKYETRVGIGFDVHQICKAKSQENNKMMICGIGIPYEKSLKGHSDADVGIHAVVDAILGAIGAGDIGEHFPPSDPEWKNDSSDVFLKHAVNLVAKKKGIINSIDITIVSAKRQRQDIVLYQGETIRLRNGRIIDVIHSDVNRCCQA